MGNLRSRSCRLGLAIISLLAIGGCGGHKPAGPSPFISRINLSPSTNLSVQLGNVISFSASAQNAAGTSISATFTFTSSDTSILNIAPNGAACAGRWNALFTTCTPGGSGAVQVTATASGISSAPTWVFVHPPIDNITVVGVLLDNQPIQEPCLSQGQTMTVEAHAFSQGSDITASVGPFTWTANNSSVVTLTPLINSAYNFATNQATAKANTPGLTQIFASATGVSSSSFRQPQISDQTGTAIPVVFDFFETCPIQNITLELGRAGSRQTSFAVNKGISQTIVATVTDVMGNSSLSNSNNGIILSKIPLTWTATQPTVIPTGTACQLSCTSSPLTPGSGAITATCAPPSCNVGYPQSPAVLSSPQCAQYFPPSCEQYIPLPVFATTAISGVSAGAPGVHTILAASKGCAEVSPVICSTGIYGFSSTKAATGVANAMPVAGNSFLYNLAGDKLYMGSAFGAQLINPANLGTTTGAFTPLGTVTGRVLAVSNNGLISIFSDTTHSPNQVYVVDATNTTSPAITALDIAGASAAAFSPDGLKTFIFGYDPNGTPNLYVRSSLQAMQVIPLPPQTSVNSIVFSTNGAFAYVAQASLAGGGPAVSVYQTCDNQLYTDTISGLHAIPLAAPPIKFRALSDGKHFVALESDGTLEYITASITGIPPATLTQPATSLCPMLVGHTAPQKVDFGQGSIQPIDFFTSADGTLLYLVASDRNSILVHDFAGGGVSGIQLVGSGNPTPISAQITPDGTQILVAGSDGLLHEISTQLGGSDMFQLSFPDLSNFSNSFCTVTPPSGPCVLDSVLPRP